MSNRSAFMAVGFLLFLLAPLPMAAQCCAAGSPSCDNGLNDLNGKHKLELAISYHYSNSDTYYDEGEVSDFVYMTNSFFRFTALQVNYGITDAWRVGAQTGYFFTKAQIFKSGFFREAVGMGDLTLNSSYTLWNKDKLHFAPMVQFTFPTGDFDQKYGPVILPIDLQPSAGSYRFGGGLISNYQATDRFALSLVSTYEYSRRIQTTYTSYKYGGLSNTRFIASYALFKGVSAGLQSWLQVRERARDNEGRTIHATGGEVLFLCPQLNWTFKNWGLNALLEQPVYKRMNGLQLTVDHRLSLRLSRTLNMALTPDLEELVADGRHTLEVDGVCGMCKNRIELTAMMSPGVINAEWNVETKLLTIQASEDFRTDQLIEALLVAGHDTEGREASQEAYNNLHECCKYRPITE